MQNNNTSPMYSEIGQLNDNLVITYQQPCMYPLSVLHSLEHNHSPCQHAGRKTVLTYIANNYLIYHVNRPTLITILVILSFSYHVQLINIVLHWLHTMCSLQTDKTLHSDGNSAGGDFNGCSNRNTDVCPIQATTVWRCVRIFHGAATSLHLRQVSVRSCRQRRGNLLGDCNVSLQFL